MTVPSEQSRIQYTTDGTSVSFPVPFRFLNAAHLQVARQHNDESSILELGVDYSVSGVGNQAGGTITTTTTLPAGDSISIERVVPITQETAYQRNDPFPERAHEQALDKLTMICQMLGGVLGLTPGSVNRALLLGAADTDGKGSYRANGNRISNLGAPKSTTDAARLQDIIERLSGLAADGSGQFVIERLADTVDLENGAGMVGFSTENSHPSGTVGFSLAKLIEWMDSRPGEGLKDLLFRQDSPDAVSRSALDKDRERVTPEDFGATGSGLILDTKFIQAAINSLALRGGGELVCNGLYLISNELKDHLCIQLHDNIKISGTGSFVVSPTTAITGDRLVTIMIGDYDKSSSNIAIEGISINANQEAIGGSGASRRKYVQGIGAQLLDPASQLKQCNDVYINNVAIFDVNIGVYCGKDTSVNHNRTDRIVNQHRNWIVTNSTISKTQNKAIEFSECFGGIARDNYLDDVTDGLQAIQGSRNTKFLGNTVRYRQTGISATHNIHNFLAQGNYLEAISTEAYAGLIVRTEPYSDDSLSQNLTFSGNHVTDTISPSKTAFAITGRVENKSYKVLKLAIIGNYLDGGVRMYGGGEAYGSGKEEIRRVRIVGNEMEFLETVGNSVSNTVDVSFNDNSVNKNYTHNARNWRFTGNRFMEMTISGVAVNTLYTGNWASKYTNNGTNTQGDGNFIAA